MSTGSRHRWLVTIGLVGLVVGAIDPLEGSIVILIASALVALGTHLDRDRHRRVAAWGFTLVLLGFIAMWTLTAIGGVGGSTGHSAWWATLVTPLVVGWALAVIAGTRVQIDHYRGRRNRDRPLTP